MIRHLYLHIPFCPRVCPYCNFYVQPADRRLSVPLVEALLAEHRWWRDHADLRPDTIYLGGGTPSALDTRSLEKLLTALHTAHNPQEFTIEINPTTLSAEKAAMLRGLGVTRASLGAQSFHPGELLTLGRQHSPERIVATYHILRDAGFDNINLDLIFGTPGGTEHDWAATLRRALDLAPEHISAYCLTYEEDTPFFERVASGQWARPDPEREEHLMRLTQRTLTAAGFTQYEVSNYARPGFESRHNIAYWRGADYLGLGPGAVSTLAALRWKNIPNVETYTSAWLNNKNTGANHALQAQSILLNQQNQKTRQTPESPNKSGNNFNPQKETRWIEPLLAANPCPRVELEHLDPTTLHKERLMLGVRTAEGIPRQPDLEPLLTRLTEAGFITLDHTRARPTPEGLLRADALATEIFQHME